MILPLLLMKLLSIEKKNSGSTETNDWLTWLREKHPTEFYLTLSCSEKLSVTFLKKLKYYISKNNHLIYINRLSYTSSQSTNCIYMDIPTLFGMKEFRHSVCRFYHYSVILSGGIFIHDNFNSLRYKFNTFEEIDPTINCIHNRTFNPIKTMEKHLGYVLTESKLNNHKSYKYYILRILREITYIFILFFTFRATKIRIAELLMRIDNHFQNIIVIYSS